MIPIFRTDSNLLAAVSAAGFLLCFSVAFSDEQAASPESQGDGGFGGPSSVSEQVKEDEKIRSKVPRLGVFDSALKPWFEFKSGLQESIGLSIAADYTALAMWAPSSPGEDNAFGGIARVYGTWTLVNPDGPYTGSLVFKGENRHRLGSDVAPQNLGFSSGYNGLPGTAFSDYEWGVTNLYWRQRLGDRASLVIGQVDVTDYLDIYGLVNPWTQFQNLSFLTNPTIPSPNQGFGASAGGMLSDNVYLLGGIADANGDPTKSPFKTVEEGEFFKHLEIGWVSSYERRYFDNIHITAWHVDEREAAGVDDGWGVSASAAWFFDDTWMPFLRAGYADGDAPLLSHSVSTGIGYYFSENKDLLGVGVNWGQPADSSLDDQWTGELFYRLQLAQNLAITPSVQLIANPALNPDDDFQTYLGVRARVTF